MSRRFRKPQEGGTAAKDNPTVRLSIRWMRANFFRIGPISTVD